MGYINPLDGKESSGLYIPYHLGVPKRGVMKWAAQPLLSRGPQMGRYQMGYRTRAIAGFPNEEELNGLHRLFRLEVLMSEEESIGLYNRLHNDPGWGGIKSAT